MPDHLGLYLSIPFCKAKCSFCNFASGVFAADRMQGYVDRLCAEIAQARTQAARLEADLPGKVDTLYFGGGTPSLLPPALVAQIFTTLRAHFSLDPHAEITVECAPGQLEDATLEQFQREGLTRVSFGIQSFVDRESAAVGRLHTGSECLSELARMRRAGIAQRSLDLIIGLPHQTAETWRHSIDQALASGAEHISVYMLEIDEDSRLGRELLSSGDRYSAGLVPDDDTCAHWYAQAVDWLAQGGLAQYEISNFARPACRSRHNIKYWQRAPYLGFGLDAHSMLHTSGGPSRSVRWANPDQMDAYLSLGPGPTSGLNARIAPGTGPAVEVDRIGPRKAFEETLFLGLRMNDGIDLLNLRNDFGSLAADVEPSLDELEDAGLIIRTGHLIQLTTQGRMVSNEVFSRLLLQEA